MNGRVRGFRLQRALLRWSSRRENRTRSMYFQPAKRATGICILGSQIFRLASDLEAFVLSQRPRICRLIRGLAKSPLSHALGSTSRQATFMELPENKTGRSLRESQGTKGDAEGRGVFCCRAWLRILLLGVGALLKARSHTSPPVAFRLNLRV